MVITSTPEMEANVDSIRDKTTEIKAFDDSKAGVKGLLDSGLKKIPRIFYTDKLNFNGSDSKLTIPIIDLKGLHGDSVLHAEIVDQIQSASQKWGVFQVINHGIPIEVLDEMLNGILRFHEQDTEVRKQFYSRESTKKVRYYSNPHMFQGREGNWRDTLAFMMAPNPAKPEEIPIICRFFFILILELMQFILEV